MLAQGAVYGFLKESTYHIEETKFKSDFNFEYFNAQGADLIKFYYFDSEGVKFNKFFYILA